MSRSVTRIGAPRDVAAERKPETVAEAEARASGLNRNGHEFFCDPRLSEKKGMPEFVCHRCGLNRAKLHDAAPCRGSTSELIRMEAASTRDLVIKGVGSKCEHCGYTKSLHVHHVLDVARGGANNPDNLIVLCPNCHALAHEAVDEIGCRIFDKHALKIALARSAPRRSEESELLENELRERLWHAEGSAAKAWRKIEELTLSAADSDRELAIARGEWVEPDLLVGADTFSGSGATMEVLRFLKNKRNTGRN